MSIRKLIPSLPYLVSTIAMSIALATFIGDCRAGAFEEPEYKTTLKVELLPLLAAYQRMNAEEPQNFVSLTITNIHRLDTAVINDIGGVVDESGECIYSVGIFKILPQETRFPIVLKPGHIAGVNQLELVVQIPNNLPFPEEAYRVSLPEVSAAPWRLNSICLRTADERPIKYPILGPVVPLTGPPDILRESRKTDEPK